MSEETAAGIANEVKEEAQQLARGLFLKAAGEWLTASRELAKAKDAEGKARDALKRVFLSRPDNANLADLTDGYQLLRKFASDKITLDEPTWDKEVAPQLKELGINADQLVRIKKELDKTFYNKCSKEVQAVADKALTFTQGSCSFEVKAPK